MFPEEPGSDKRIVQVHRARYRSGENCRDTVTNSLTRTRLTLFIYGRKFLVMFSNSHQ